MEDGGRGGTDEYEYCEAESVTGANVRRVFGVSGREVMLLGDVGGKFGGICVPMGIFGMGM